MQALPQAQLSDHRRQASVRRLVWAPAVQVLLLVLAGQAHLVWAPVVQVLLSALVGQVVLLLSHHLPMTLPRAPISSLSFRLSTTQVCLLVEVARQQPLPPA